MTREHDPLLRDQWEIGALQQAGNRDVDEVIDWTFIWMFIVGAIGGFACLVYMYWRLW